MGTATAYSKTQSDTLLGAKAPLASPALTGTPTAPTPSGGDSTTKIATTAFIQAALAALVASSPAALDTLKELADAIGDDPNFATTVTNSLAAKAPLASPAFTGTPTIANAHVATTQIIRRSASLLPGVVIANASKVATYQTTTQTGTYRVPYKIVYTASEIRLVFRNGGNNSGSPYSDVDGSAVITLNVSVEDPTTSTIYRVTFNGRITATLDPGAFVTSDPIALDLAAGAVLYVRSYVSATAAYYFTRANNSTSGTVAGAGGYTATTDLTAPGSAAIADSNSFMYGPVAVIANASTVNAPPIIGSGDSIMFGQGDTANTAGMTNTSTNADGWFERAFFGVRGTVNLAKASEAAYQFINVANHFRRAAFIPYGAWLLCAYGVNDFGLGGRSASQIQTALIAHWAMGVNRGVRALAQTTLTPSSTSTDSWATTGNQTTHANNAARVSTNQWLRAGAPMVNGAAVAIGTNGAVTCDLYQAGSKTFSGTGGHPLSFVIDNASIVESATDSGLWKASYTADGLHPNPTAHAALAAAVPVSAFI